jgi:hypothetical protein
MKTNYSEKIFHTLEQNVQERKIFRLYGRSYTSSERGCTCVGGVNFLIEPSDDISSQSRHREHFCRFKWIIFMLLQDEHGTVSKDTLVSFETVKDVSKALVASEIPSKYPRSFMIRDTFFFI